MKTLIVPRIVPLMVPFIAVLLFSCTPKKDEAPAAPQGPSLPTFPVDVSWDENRETDVNAAGGGYRVYHASTAGVNTSTAAFVDVPYVSGSSAPVTARLNLPEGVNYIRVVAYSAFGLSADSDETSVTVP